MITVKLTKKKIKLPNEIIYMMVKKDGKKTIYLSIKNKWSKKAKHHDQ